MLGATEIIIIAGVILILFGATAIPKFARSLGKAKKEFEQGINEANVGEKKNEGEEQIEEKRGEKPNSTE